MRFSCYIFPYFQPFWRVWHPPGSDGRGVIGITRTPELTEVQSFGYIAYLYYLLLPKGVLEANFIEPAHDKQGFERTTVLAKLEARLVLMQKNYWLVFFSSGCVPRT